jgi:hypothetical protein
MIQNALMSYADLTADDWDRLPDERASSLAREIADRQDLRLVELGWHEYAGTSQRRAIFERAGLQFALVPGGQPVLGYDANRFQPTPSQAESYGFSAAEYGLPSLAEYIDRATSPVRSVELPAMLVAVELYEPCAQDLSLEDPRVQQLVANARHRPGGRAMVSGPAGKVEVQFGADGQVSRAREMVQVSYDSAVQRCAQDGLRLSTPDEWEYAPA